MAYVQEYFASLLRNHVRTLKWLMKFRGELINPLDQSQEIKSLISKVHKARIECENVQDKIQRTLDSVQRDIASATAKLNDISQSHADNICNLKQRAYNYKERCSDHQQDINRLRDRMAFIQTDHPHIENDLCFKFADSTQLKR